MLVSEILTRVQRQFGDSANIQIDSTDIIRWINDAQREISLQNNLFQNISTTGVVAGTGTLTLPADAVTIRSVQLNGAKIKSMNTNEAEQFIVGDAQAIIQGTPQRFWIWANTINLYPVPDTTYPAGLKIYYTRSPVAVTLVTDTPELPLYYHNAIVQYCLQQAYELDENWAAAQAKGSQFDNGVKLLKDNIDWVERDFYPMITSTDIAENTGSWYGW